MLVRYPNGLGGEFFYQKRAPEAAAGLDRGRHLSAFPPAAQPMKSCPATRLRSPGWPTSPAWSCTRIRCARRISIIPDELRVDLDPVPGVEWAQLRQVARVVRATLDDFGLVGWPKTSGSRGIHVYVRHRTAVDVYRSSPSGARVCARGRASRARRCDQQVVERRAPRRLSRLQPERQGSHDRRRLLGPAEAGCARLRAAGLGRDRRLAIRLTSR